MHFWTNLINLICVDILAFSNSDNMESLTLLGNAKTFLNAGQFLPNIWHGKLSFAYAYR